MYIYIYIYILCIRVCLCTGEYFVEFRALKVTCVIVSPSCPFSSNVSFVNTEYMKR